MIRDSLNGFIGTDVDYLIGAMASGRSVRLRR